MGEGQIVFNSSTCKVEFNIPTYLSFFQGNMCDAV